MEQVFAALSHPTRLAIVNLLKNSEGTSVNGLVAKLGVSQPTVSKHLGIMRAAHLVKVEMRAQERYYSLNKRVLHQVEAWASNVLSPQPEARLITRSTPVDYSVFDEGFAAV